MVLSRVDHSSHCSNLGDSFDIPVPPTLHSIGNLIDREHRRPGQTDMVTVDSLDESFRATASNGRVELPIDAPADKGGQGAGFGAHELLETAIAGCLNMAVRMYAAKHGIPLTGVRTRVQIVRPDPGIIRFEQSLEFHGDLSDEQRRALIKVADTCPVRQTLAKKLVFGEIT